MLARRRYVVNRNHQEGEKDAALGAGGGNRTHICQGVLGRSTTKLHRPTYPMRQPCELQPKSLTRLRISRSQLDVQIAAHDLLSGLVAQIERDPCRRALPSHMACVARDRASPNADRIATATAAGDDASGQFATAPGAQHRLQCRRIGPDGNPNDCTADHISITGDPPGCLERPSMAGLFPRLLTQ